MKATRIYNLFVTDADNVGDLVAGPIDYFDFPNAKKMNLRGWEARKDELKGQFIVLGGGGLIHLPSPEYNNGRIGWLDELLETTPYIVSWGLGHNVYSLTDFEYPECLDHFLANGVRDQGVKFDWVPCASCMDPSFHHRYKIKHEIVVFEAGIQLQPFGFGSRYPKKRNTGSFKACVKFLAEGETIFTNSYHGAYWGMLLGRKVVVINPHSSKFYAIHPGVGFCRHKENLDAIIGKTESDKTFLAECRSRNKKYYTQVLDLIKKHVF